MIFVFLWVDFVSVYPFVLFAVVNCKRKRRKGSGDNCVQKPLATLVARCSGGKTVNNRLNRNDVHTNYDSISEMFANSVRNRIEWRMECLACERCDVWKCSETHAGGGNQWGPARRSGRAECIAPMPNGTRNMPLRMTDAFCRVVDGRRRRRRRSRPANRFIALSHSK